MVYFTSDVHGAFDIHKINPSEFIEGQQLTRDDIVCVCGDFGCVWDGGSSDGFWLKWLESLPWTTVFLDGNHENFDVLKTFPVVSWKGGKVHQIRSNVLHLLRGEIYTVEGKTWLCLGGGFSHDRKLRVPSRTWWNEEIISSIEADHARTSLDKAGWSVDYILSHDVPASHPCSSTYEIDMDGYSSDRVHQQKFLEEIRQSTKYSAWFCGHYHQDRLDMLSGRPCFMLFDTVEQPEKLIQDSSLLKTKPEKDS